MWYLIHILFFYIRLIQSVAWQYILEQRCNQFLTCKQLCYSKEHFIFMVSADEARNESLNNDNIFE